MPGVRVTSVRRTVVVAVALVTGQALLCGIIGFVTFGDRGGAPPGGGAAEPQIAGPPVVLPPSSEPPADEPAERPEPGSSKPVRTERPTSPPGTAAGRGSATRAAGPSRTTPAPVAPEPPPVPVPSTSPTDRELLPPATPAPGDDAPGNDAPGDDVPEPVVEKEPCDEAGATGATPEGKIVRCERDRNGELRWRLV
jgi:hypothetical protein